MVMKRVKFRWDNTQFNKMIRDLERAKDGKSWMQTVVYLVKMIGEERAEVSRRTTKLRGQITGLEDKLKRLEARMEELEDGGVI